MLIKVRTFLSDPSPYYCIRFRTLLADPSPQLIRTYLTDVPNDFHDIWRETFKILFLVSHARKF